MNNMAFVAMKMGPALGGIASPRSVVPEPERVCRSSDWNTSVSLARLCGARGRAPSRSGASQHLRPYVGAHARLQSESHAIYGTRH
jgi:hypothetical protein